MVKNCILIIFICCFSANIYSSDYSVRMSDRPLTLTKGLWEIDFVTYFSKPESDNYFFNVSLYPRYGITDNIELSLFGVRYNVTNLSPKYEMAFRLRIPNFGYSDREHFVYSIEGGVTGKYKVNDSSVLMFDLSEVYDPEPDDNIYKFSLNSSYLYSFTNNLSFSALMGAHKVTFSESIYKVAYVTTYYTYTSNLDFYASIGYRGIGSLNETKYYLVDEKIVFGLGLLWRI